MKKTRFAQTHEKNWAQKHPGLLRWTTNEQFDSKMKLPLKRVSKIICTSLTSCNKGSLFFQGGTSSTKEEFTKEGDWKIIIATAESFLDNLIKSVENGTVTVVTLNVLKEHSEQFLGLVEIHQTNQKVSIEVSVKDFLSQRCSELDAFLTLQDHMVCFIGFSRIFTSGMSVLLIVFKSLYF